jgi:prefoldin alpha subunit
MSSAQPATLSNAQVVALKMQLEQEIQVFKSSFSQLKIAHSKFQSSLSSVQSLRERTRNCSSQESAILPITSSLFLKGTIDLQEPLLVDIGTGYLMPKELSEAEGYFRGKVNYVGEQLEKLNELLVQRTNSLSTVDAFLAQQSSSSTGQLSEKEAICQ